MDSSNNSDFLFFIFNYIFIVVCVLAHILVRGQPVGIDPIIWVLGIGLSLHFPGSETLALASLYL